jgi:2-alkenal reductase
MSKLLPSMAEARMRDRFTRLMLGVLLVLVAAFVTQPYIDRVFFSATPRPVEPRGSLAEAERTAIEIFDRVSPSVVQVVARSAGARAPGLDRGLASTTLTTGVM